MKYMKAMVTVIDLSEEEILTASTCPGKMFKKGDECEDQSSYDKYWNCKTVGHQNN